MAVPFLTTSYFVGELIIPNLTSTTAAGTANIAELQWFINTYEKEFLKYLLGDNLYDEFVAGIAVAEPLAKWTNLKNQIYDGTNFISPAAGYVYFFFRRNRFTITMGSSEVKPLHENGETVGHAAKQVMAWNNMVKQCEDIWEWLEESTQAAIYTTYSDEFHGYLTRINEFGI